MTRFTFADRPLSSIDTVSSTSLAVCFEKNLYFVKFDEKTVQFQSFETFSIRNWTVQFEIKVILTAHFGFHPSIYCKKKNKISKRIFSFIDIIYTNTNLFVLYIFAVSNNMYQITDIISRDTIFFFIVFLFTGFCNTGSGFGYFQIKSKHLSNFSIHSSP